MRVSPYRKCDFVRSEKIAAMQAVGLVCAKVGEGSGVMFGLNGGQTYLLQVQVATRKEQSQ
jgi:hypothetical protein